MRHGGSNGSHWKEGAGNRVMSSSTPGVTAAESTQCQVAALGRAMKLKRLQ